MEQQATERSDCYTAQGLGEGPENQKAAGNADFEGHAESCWKIELPKTRPVHLAEEIENQQSVQIAACLLSMANSRMREQRELLNVKLAKKKVEQNSQRSSHQDLKKKGLPEEALSEETKAEKQRLPGGHPGNEEDSSSGSQRRIPKLSGKLSLLAEGVSKPAAIPRGQDAASTSGGPCEHPCCRGNYKDLKKIAMEVWRLPPLSRRNPSVSMKIASKLESLWIECEEVMPPGPVVMEPQREHEKTPFHED